MDPIQDVDGIIAIVCVIMIMSAINLQHRDRLRGRQWVRPWIARRGQYGAYHALMQELRQEDPRSYKNFVRMDKDTFTELLELVTPLIKKKDTFMRNSISAAERLALTLRYLATGDSYATLQYLYRVPATTVSEIIPETCQAIYNVLRNTYIKVTNFSCSFKCYSLRIT
ncbi:uncharacterized protein LOC128553673 [Mercenaria mercenaria]|uniref:uncharacterized protein LOC128553673 n=1 Tax=Mercenaria mercenaria TaxID=6596 RepID=UPI00234F9E36|nr:uncharacterized protein LOC128553673 [Mercenaria mercenaria]